MTRLEQLAADLASLTLTVVLNAAASTSAVFVAWGIVHEAAGVR